MAERNTTDKVCREQFERWWTATFWPHDPPTYDNSIDKSADCWEGWQAAWQAREPDPQES